MMKRTKNFLATLFLVEGFKIELSRMLHCWNMKSELIRKD
jgi:hypothetical protein